MDKLERPSKLIAILFIVSAACSPISLVLKVAGRDAGAGRILFQVLTVMLLIIAAAGNWHLYVRRYVNYEVERKLEKEE